MNQEKWHGTIGGYSNHDCRCEHCTFAWKDYSKLRRKDQAIKERVGFYGTWPKVRLTLTKEDVLGQRGSSGIEITGKGASFGGKRRKGQ